MNNLDTWPHLETQLTALTPPTLKSAPFRLLEYYRAADAALFYGRERETERLSSLIHGHRLVLLYGASGMGKTSLLLAGVEALFQREQVPYHLVYVRTLEDPLQAVRRTLQRRLPGLLTAVSVELEETAVLDLPVLQHLMVTSFDLEELKDLCFGLTIMYDDRPGITLSSKSRELLTYCARRGHLPHLVAACRQLRPMVSWPGVADTSVSPIATGPSLLTLLDTAGQHLRQTIVLILDQFEEFFTRFSPATRSAFWTQLSDLYHATDVPVKIVLSLREDHLAAINELEPFIPEVFQIQMRLLPLSPEEAPRAIVNPFAKVGIRCQPEMITRLVNDLLVETTTGQRMIGLPQLQLVCSELYAQYSHKGQITLADYDALGGAGGVGALSGDAIARLSFAAAATGSFGIGGNG